MTLRPECLKCYDTGYYAGEPQPHNLVSGQLIYPSVMCTCTTAVKWAESHAWSDRVPGKWDGECYSVHPVHFTWYARDGIWVPLDFGIIDDIQWLWRLGFDTLYSCEGGNSNSRYIKFRYPTHAKDAGEMLGWVSHVDEERSAVYDRKCKPLL